MSCDNDLFVALYGKKRKTIEPDTDPTISTGSAYAAGDSLHGSYLEFSGCGRTDGGTGRVVEVGIKEDSNGSAAAKPGLNWWFFNTAPTSQTANSLVTLSNTDFDNLISDGLSMASATVTIGAIDQAIAAERDLDIQYQCGSADTKLYVVLEMIGAPTLAAGTTITPYIKIERD